TGDTLDVSVFAHDEMTFILSPAHPWAIREQLSLSELAHIPLIARERGSGTRAVIEAALERAAFDWQPAMSLGSTEAVKVAVAQGLGGAFVSRITVELEVRSGALVEVPVSGVVIQRALHRVLQRGKHPSAAALAFFRLLEAHLPNSPAAA